jgi:hypothetical protein
MQMSGQFQVTAFLLSGNKPPFLIKENHECAPETISTLWRGEKFKVSAEIHYQKYKNILNRLWEANI